MQIRVTIENGDALAQTFRRESVMPIPEDGRLHIELPVHHTRLLRELMDAVDGFITEYAEHMDTFDGIDALTERMARLDTVYFKCKKEA